MSWQEWKLESCVTACSLFAVKKLQGQFRCNIKPNHGLSPLVQQQREEEQSGHYPTWIPSHILLMASESLLDELAQTCEMSAETETVL